MANLRDAFNVNNTLTGLQHDQIRASQMGSLRRSWEGGRLGTEANALASEEYALRAAGEEVKAQALRDQISAIQQRQAVYRPDVAQIEDIKGVTDIPGFVAGQIGQGAASMVEPAAIATGVTALGTGLRMAPNAVAKGVGTFLQRYGAPAAAFGVNQDQLRGEFINDAVRDPELMARTSPQQLSTTAHYYGVGAGLLDTILPAGVGRVLGGAGRAAVRSGGTFGARTLRNMGMEGATETAQNVGSQQTQAYLNPNRDTSGDLMENVNAFVGGAVGGSPFAAIEAAGDTGARRLSSTLDAVKAKAGETIDMAKEASGPLRDKMAEGFETGKEKVIDLKARFKETSQAVASKWNTTEEERAIISGVPPEDIANDEAAFTAWAAEITPKRQDMIAERLTKMAQAGDAKANDFLRGMASEDDQEYSAAMDGAAEYILGNDEVDALLKQGGRFADATKSTGKTIGKAGMWAARKAAGFAKDFGSAVLDGAKGGSKKNAQEWSGADVDAEFAARKERGAELMQRASLMGEYLATTARDQSPALAGRPAEQRSAIADLMKDLGYEIADLADLGTASKGDKTGAAKRGAALNKHSLGVNRIVNSLRVAYGAQAPEVVQNLRAMAGPAQAKVFDAMEQELQTQLADKAGTHTAGLRRAAAAELLTALPPEAETALMKEGINLRAPESQRKLLGMVEQISLGRATPAARKALEGLVGREPLNAMLAIVAPETEPDANTLEGVLGGMELDLNEGLADEGFEVDDDGELTQREISAFDKVGAEKMAAKGSGSKLFGFANTKARSNVGKRDPFAATTKLTKKEYAEFVQTNNSRKAMGEDPLPDPRRRPALFTKGQQLHEKSGGGSAVEARVLQLQKLLKVDKTPERMIEIMESEGNTAGAQKVRERLAKEGGAESLKDTMRMFFTGREGNWRVKPQSALDVLKEQGAQPARILALYRDYLRQDGEGEKAELVNQVLLDMMDGDKQSADGTRRTYRTGPKARKDIPAAAQQYFAEREIVVAERMTNKDVTEIDANELKAMHEAASKVVSLSRQDGGHKRIAAANILVFESPLGTKNKYTGKSELFIKVADLVRMVQEGRNATTENDFEDTRTNYRNTAKNQRQLDMILDGVGSVMASGHVTGWPYKTNEQGQREYFGEGDTGVPPSLLLATTDMAGFTFARKKAAERAKGESITDPESDKYQDDVAEDQNKRKEYFSPDARVEQEPGGYKDGRAVYDDLNDVQGRVRNAGFRGLQLANRTDRRAPDRRGGDNQTPLDVQRKPKGGKAVTGAPDEFADQRARSVAQGYNAAATPPSESKATAVTRAAERATEIIATLKEDFAAGVAMIEARLRTAAGVDTVFVTKDGVKDVKLEQGHYVAPLAHVLSAESMASYDITPAEAKQLQALRIRTAEMLLKAGFKNSDLVTLTRAMADAAAAKYIAAPGVRKYLEKVVNKGKAQAPAPAPTTGRSDAYYAAENFEDISTNAQADEFLRGAQARLNELKAMDDLTAEQKKAYAVLDGLFGRASTADLGSFYPDGRSDDAVRKSLASAAEGGARLGKPVGGVDLGAVPSRLRHLGAINAVYLVGTRRRGLSDAINAQGSIIDDARASWSSGTSKQEFMRSTLTTRNISRMLAAKIRGVEGAQQVIDIALGSIDQVFGMPFDTDLEGRLRSRLRGAKLGGAELGPFLADIRGSAWPAGAKAVAAAVAKVAGQTKVVRATALGDGDADGWYASDKGKIFVADVAERPGIARTILHEGVHAATISAIVGNPELHKAMYSLMAHVATKSPKLAAAYGMTNTLEFVAEGLSNIEFQRELYKIAPSAAVEKYLGKTLANAWDAFVELVRNALNLPAAHTSALTQLIDLSGRAMKETASTTDVVVDAGALGGLADREIVPAAKRKAIFTELVNSPHLTEDARTEISALMSDEKMSHASALLFETVSAVLPDFAQSAGGPLDLAAVEDLSGWVAANLGMQVVASRTPKLNAQGGTKRNAQADQIHRDLGRRGFAATHDSPIRHAGIFNWRLWFGKGEGNAAFGAGTYLSTANGVHKSYKGQFTKELPGARILEWAGRLFEYDPDGGEIYIDGVPAKTGSAEYEVAHAVLAYGMPPGDALQYAREHAYSVVDRSGADIADAIDTSEPNVPSKDLAYVLSALRNRQQLDVDKIHSALKPFLNAERWNRMVVAGDRRAEALKDVDISALRTPLNAVSPTYQVSVDIAPEQLLNWDAPISQQSPLVRKALKDAGVKTMASVTDIATGREVDTVALDGAAIYKNLAKRLGSQAKASDYLQSLGILGHRYASVGGKNDVFPNYVIYDDSKITTNYVHFNAQDPRDAGPRAKSTQAERDEAVAYIRKVLGDKVKVEFADITGFSGEFVDVDNTIRISTTPAAGTLQTAYHEALHGFVKHFIRGNPLGIEVLSGLADHQPTLARVRALLSDFPAAQAALVDGEERIAYIYQFWAAGMLDLPYGKPRTLLQKLRKFFRVVLGRVSDLERSVGLLEALHGGQLGGDPSVAGQIVAGHLNLGTWTPKMVRKLDRFTQGLGALTLPANTVLASSDSNTARLLAKEFWTNPGDEAAGDAKEGYLNARERMARRYTNEFAQAVEGLSDRDMRDVMNVLQQEQDNLGDLKYEPALLAAKKIRGLLQRFRTYMVDERGLKIGDRGPHYFPRVWSVAALNEKGEDFVQMLTTKYAAQLFGSSAAEKEKSARRLLSTLIANGSVDGHLSPEREDGVLTPFFASGNERTLWWMAGEDVAPFVSKDLIGTLTGYFHAGARAAEYAHRFGAKGEKLQDALKTVHEELLAASKRRAVRGEFADDKARLQWVQRQMRDVRHSVGAMEGTLGKDGNPTARKINSYLTVYQNVRLLPLALFASVVDPLGLVARGGTLRDAYDSMLRAMKEVAAGWGDMFRDEPKERQADKWQRLAQAAGTVDAAIFSHHVADEYASAYMAPGAKKVNDAFFRANGMERWNVGMRVGATRAAVQFLERHKKSPGEHSARWLKELGLTAGDVELNADGELITDWHELAAKTGASKEVARAKVDKIHYALNRWVQGAVITPNAAQRPAWSSDPSYSMFFHLKQFSYSFHQTVLKRAVKELEHGNLAPMGAFAWYIPTMIVTDIVKGLALGGGELPAHMKGMNLGDWLMHGVERSGALAIGQLGVDAYQDPSSLGGPAVEQIIDGFRDDFGTTTLKALPAHGLYREALR